jgi:hypothetical protein
VAFTTGVLAVFIANAPQLIFEVLCILLMKKRVNTESAKENCSLLAFQFFMAVVVVYLLAQTTYDVQLLVRSQKEAMVIVYTFIFSFLVDQIKSIGSNLILYFMVIRRFGYLPENEKDFVNKENLKMVSESNLVKL